MKLNVGAALALLTVLATPAAAIECHSARGHDGRYWAWRDIGGRHCWYAGPRGLSKAKLAWHAAHNRQPLRSRKKEPPRPSAPAPARDDLMETVWPTLPPSDTFAERWRLK